MEPALYRSILAINSTFHEIPSRRSFKGNILEGTYLWELLPAVGSRQGAEDIRHAQWPYLKPTDTTEDNQSTMQPEKQLKSRLIYHYLNKICVN